ncbi:MAG: nitroreductase [Chloroflexi bacterium]|nr:nitroreductase [Chloroflexota bacterium]
MDVIEAIQTRKSIRGFKPDPVPKDVLKEIISIASRAPSALNSQPWECTVVAGEVLEKIRRGNIEEFTSGVGPHPEIVWHDRLVGDYRKRQVSLGIQLFQLMGIAREDREKKIEWTKLGFRFFDAPAAIILYIDESMRDVSQFDIGTLTQTIALAAVNYGLGTCIQGQGLMYPEVIRKYTGIPETKRLSINLAIGYPDWDFPANKVQSEREPLEITTTWFGL